MTKDLQGVLDRVDENFQQEMAFLVDLVQIPSVHLENVEEERCQDLVADHLGALGLWVDRFIPDWAALEAYPDPVTG